MTVYADLAPCTYFGEQPARILRAVGWLGRDGFPVGRTEERVYRSVEALLVDPFQPVVFGGFHECEVCQFRGESRGGRNLFVPGAGLIYVCPELILHYMNAHHYAPHPEFCAAVIACPDTRTIEYKKAFLAAGGKALLHLGRAN